ncbi:acyl-CoA dehydrogenase [Mycobacteroides abscessus subsp. abscessus]|nr:acyl-CoA dehydrogenase [Mycobacteroides abscessus subsp. abscessus]
MLRAHALRTMEGGGIDESGQASVAKLLWANWHRGLGELAMAVRGAEGLVAGEGDLDEWPERVLGLPREARP